MGFNLASLLVKLGLDSSDYISGLDKASKHSKSFASGVTSSLAGVGGAILTGSVAAIGGIGALVIKTANTSDELAELSAKTGINVEKLQELKYIGEQVGTPLETMTGSLAFLTRSMAGASEGTGKGMDAFNKLGVSVIDSQGNLRDSNDVFSDTIDALRGVTNETERNALSMAIFGRGAMELNPLIETSKEDLDNMATAARNSGAIMSESTVMAAAELKDKMDGLKAGISGTAGALVSEFIPSITTMVDSVATNIPIVVEWFKKSFGWLQENEGIIVGALAAIGVAILAFVYTTVIPAALAIIGSLAPVILIMAAIGAVAYVLYEAWTNNWGGMRDIIMDMWNNNLKPIFEAVVLWLQNNIPVALKFLSDLWQNTLLPAIKVVWDFLSTYIIPLFDALANVYFALLKKQLESYAILWTNVLAPALEKTWGWFNDKIIPVLKRVAEWVGDKVGPAFEGLRGALLDVIGWLDNLAEKLNNLHLPDWLTPGSATPFEIGLRGISGEMASLAQLKLPMFNAKLGTLPNMTNATVGGNVSSGRSGGSTINLNVSVSGAIGDPQETGRQMVPALRYALRELGVTGG